MTRTTARLVRIAGGAIAGALILAGCSDSNENSDAAASTSDTPASETAAFNNADVSFVQGMIPHHRGALEMAQLADGRAQDPRVLDLASRIEAAQEPEIENMTAWLEEWGEPVPEETEDQGMGGMDHGSMGGSDMEGMSEEDMTSLEAASGAEFDRMFLEMMIEHHRGAVDMAQTEIDDGTYPGAVQMAEDIVASQTAEIEEMETLLSELGS
ncbi:DUF305 domain-containing protein [Candidatus Blastococcus massiliensis]|uniref:DUF305 domain-containing protein n=1 Tax=Candidatus Blastococcus massiliensis TaxID=1470358 RepID=UPI0004B1A9A7|nr:DUF305 domain-containing protein [Candidatus Blastococcus massiliensis]